MNSSISLILIFNFSYTLNTKTEAILQLLRAQNCYLKRIPLHIALQAKCPHLGLIKYLISEGSDLKVSDDWDRPALGFLFRSRLGGKAFLHILNMMLERDKDLCRLFPECLVDLLLWRGRRDATIEALKICQDHGARVGRNCLPLAARHTLEVFKKVLAITFVGRSDS